MRKKTDSQIYEGKTKYKNFECREDYIKCQYYHSEEPEESRCQNDSSVGLCVKEWFDYYNKYEVIVENGDTE